MEREKELTKNTMIITIGRISTQFVSFLLLPLYTSLLTTDEYGTVDLVVTLVNLLIPIVSIMTDQGAFRFLLNCETEKDKKRIISSAFFLLLSTVAATLIIYAAVSPFVHTGFKLWLVLILAATAFSNLFLQIARGLHKTADYALGSFICSSVTIILNVLCIAFLHMGAVGMLVAALTGNVICSLSLFLKLGIAKYISFRSFEKGTAKELLKYSSPLVPHQLSLWIMNSSDRLIVAFFLGTAANGVLAISHKFPAIFMTFYSIFQLAWHETGAVHFFDEDRDEFFTNLINRIIMIFSSLCLCVIGVLPICFDWLVKSDFTEAYYNIPIYMVASLCNVVVGLLGVVYVATKKTGEIAKTTMIAAAINIVVNLALIKTIGLYAASLSTLAGYLVTMIYRIKDTKKYLNIKYDTRQNIGICAALAVCCGVYYINSKIVSLIFFPMLVIAVYMLNKDLVQTVLCAAEKKTGIAKRTISLCIVVGIIAVIVAGGILAAEKVVSRGEDIASEYGDAAVSVEAVKTIMFSDFGETDFTCTGLAYDEKDPGFWIADYGALSPESDTHPRIIKVDRAISEVQQSISLEGVLPKNANLQGIAYDKFSDTLWIAADNSVAEISKSGDMLRTFSIGRFSKHQANGICCDTDRTLWILCRTKYLLHYNKEGDLIDSFPFNYKDQDHISTDGTWLYISVGADYQGNNNFVVRVDPKNGSINSIWSMNSSHAVEGLTFDGQKLYVANDGSYHRDSVGHSYISIYETSDIKENSLEH